MPPVKTLTSGVRCCAYPTTWHKALGEWLVRSSPAGLSRFSDQWIGWPVCSELSRVVGCEMGHRSSSAKLPVLSSVICANRL